MKQTNFRKINYALNRNWSDKLLDQVISIIEDNLSKIVDISIADDEKDMKQSTDLVIKIQSGGDIAVRTRRSSYKYRDLTIRSSLPTGNRTELDKLKEGYAKYYFYGWTTDENEIQDWILIDLDKVRQKNILNINWTERTNKDGTKFICIPARQLYIQKCLVNYKYTKNEETEDELNITPEQVTEWENKQQSKSHGQHKFDACDT